MAERSQPPAVGLGPRCAERLSLLGVTHIFPATLPDPFPSSSSLTSNYVSSVYPYNPVFKKTLNTDTKWQEVDDNFKLCLESNKKWAGETAKADAAFFPTSSKGQSPPILWLGCSDSRVPETTLLGMKPGDVFTHRNIANIMHATDLSSLSVIYFAVAHLGVKHIVLCGHTSCGGVAGALGNDKLGLLDVWLQPLRELREKHADELAKLEGAEKTTYLSELNVKAGVEVLRRNPTVIDAMKERDLKVHGVIYDLASGTLREIACEEHETTGSNRVAAFERK
ncbi:Hypothetical protein R9X50_00308400 [Acrodontium crateriforme]|uniref:Carbonic anhydrase n=1 Tax=Acrodontium crateriforme TaxID=150365 RepID=A0AAQ3M3P8_9PEZI|nr:Hypothetical protein R9X50_00308400 [Acrodontium crateriforme]